jgi:integrase
MTTKTRVRGRSKDARKTERRHLTDKRIEALAIPEKATSIYDLKQPALGLRLTPKGKRTFFWFRAVAGRPKWITIGEWPDVKLEGPNGARAKAEELNVTLANWKKDGCKTPNPFERPDDSAPMTLERLVEKYIDEHVMLTAKDKEKSAKSIRDTFTWYLPDWKQKGLGEIRRPDVLSRYAKLWRDIGGSTANHAIALLRAIYKWAIAREIFVGKNPGVLLKDDAQYKDVQRVRCLTPEEMERLCTVCDDYRKGSQEHKDLADFVMLALGTGQRKKTVMHARWDAIDLKKRTWKLTAAETKNRKPFTAELYHPFAVKVLTEREHLRKESAFVFPGIDPKKARFDFNGAMWKKFLERCELDYPREDPRNFRIHDLRHSAISYAVKSGQSLEKVAHAFGHASVRSTARYAHLGKEDAKETMSAVGREMARQMAAVERKQLPAAG